MTRSGSFDALGAEAFDAVVVGAGPAGAMTARELARRGARVLIVERRAMPRWKVCGACVGASGARTLERAGLGGLLGSIGGVELDRVELCARGRRVGLTLRGVSSVSRSALDAALLREAGAAGAVVLSGVVADGVLDGRVTLRRGGRRVEVRGRSVVAAGGLGTATALGLGGARIARRSWIGLGTTAGWAGEFGTGRTLLMLVGERGYVGRVRTEDGMANWAAAIDPVAMRDAGGVVGAVRAICREAGADPEVVPETGWRGTPKLTRVGPVQRGGVYAVGDAAGYVEPITGEGISWALATGAALGEALGEALERGEALVDWRARWRRMMRVRRARCAMVAGVLRRPGVVALGARALGARPGLGGAFIGGLIGGRAALGAGGPR